MQLCNLFTRLFPRVSVTLLLGWSYWALLFKGILIIPDVSSITSTMLFVILTYLFVVCLWTYYSVLVIGPGSPTEFPMLMVPNYREDEDGNVIDGSGLSPPERFINLSMMVKSDGGFRFCSKCKCWKPDRSHHCSSSGKCVLKMDHYCPWFSECIGFRNHRYFVLFLINVEMYLIVATLYSCWILIQFFVEDRYPVVLFSFHILFVFCLGFVFSICMLFFTGFTVYQVLKNRTTIESYERQRYRNRHRNGGREMGNVFDLGWKRNWQVVMGDHWWQWFVPVRYVCSEDELYREGLCFPLRRDVASGLLLVERLARASGEFSV